MKNITLKGFLFQKIRINTNRLLILKGDLNFIPHFIFIIHYSYSLILKLPI